MSDLGLHIVNGTVVIDPVLRRQRRRLGDILRRHVRIEDEGLSDMDFVKAVLKRASVQWGWALVDPNE